jgi:hypothetical protein
MPCAGSGCRRRMRFAALLQRVRMLPPDGGKVSMGGDRRQNQIEKSPGIGRGICQVRNRFYWRTDRNLIRITPSSRLLVAIFSSGKI